MDNYRCVCSKELIAPGLKLKFRRQLISKRQSAHLAAIAQFKTESQL